MNGISCVVMMKMVTEPNAVPNCAAGGHHARLARH